MNISFTTKNIDKSLYEKCILKFIYEHYIPDKKNYHQYLKQDIWEIEIKPLSEFDFSFYDNFRRDELSSNMAHGVTGENQIVCYIHDIAGNYFAMQNLSVITHELGHMILKVKYPHRQTKQRHSDFYSKSGNTRKYFSSEIHDRLTEGKVRKCTVWKNRFRKFSFYGIDIMDLI